MKTNVLLLLAGLTARVVLAETPGDYRELIETRYNSIIVEKRGSIVELRSHLNSRNALESAVDVDAPLNLLVPYTRTLYSALFFDREPAAVLMVGLGGAGFHRLFSQAFPNAQLQTVEIDETVIELAKTRLMFAPNKNTPIICADARQFLKRDGANWSWIILDAYRKGSVPPHLKTKEFYELCRSKLRPNGILIANVNSSSELYWSDLKTIQSVFKQLVLFHSNGTANVIVCAFHEPSRDYTSDSNWNTVESLNPRLGGFLDMKKVRSEFISMPEIESHSPMVLTDDFNPVEFLDFKSESPQK